MAHTLKPLIKVGPYETLTPPEMLHTFALQNLISELKTPVFREGQIGTWEYEIRIRFEKLYIHMLWEVSASPWASITTHFTLYKDLLNAERLALYGWVASGSCPGSSACPVLVHASSGWGRFRSTPVHANPVRAGSCSRWCTQIRFTPVPVLAGSCLQPRFWFRFQFRFCVSKK